MPTAAKLISAILFGALAWTVSQLFKPLMPEETQFGWFSEINAALAAYLAWRIVGPRAEDGFKSGVSAGLTCALALFVSATMLHSFAIMIKRSLENRYGGPEEALKSMVRMAMEFAQPALTPEVIGSLLVGGLLAGFLAAATARVWP